MGDGIFWSQHSTLQYSRYQHTSLAGQHGLLLMGGQYSSAITELVGGGQHYNLQQGTRYACGITEPGSDNIIILTGGYGPMNTVAKYGPIRHCQEHWDMLLQYLWLTLTLFFLLEDLMDLAGGVRYSPSTAAWPGVWWEHYRRENIKLLLLL